MNLPGPSESEWHLSRSGPPSSWCSPSSPFALWETRPSRGEGPVIGLDRCEPLDRGSVLAPSEGRIPNGPFIGIGIFDGPLTFSSVDHRTRPSPRPHSSWSPAPLPRSFLVAPLIAPTAYHQGVVDHPTGGGSSHEVLGSDPLVTKPGPKPEDGRAVEL